jgi:putative ATP-binding cassette transporter
MKATAPTINPVPGERGLLTRYWQSASGFWVGPAAWRAWVLLASLVATAILQLMVQYRLNFWNRDFFDAIERKDESQLWAQAAIFLPLAAISLTLALFSVWSRMRLQRNWREWLSNNLYDYWLEHDRYSKIGLMQGDHLNPEYRIAEDARLATDLPIDLMVGLFSSLLTGIAFIGILWSVGGGLVIHLYSLTLAIPGYLLIAVIIYSTLLVTATAIIGRHLMRVIQDNKRAEAELRAVGAKLREGGEDWGGPPGNKDGRRIVGAALDQVIEKWRALCWQLMRMTLVSHSNILLTPFIALLLCTPKYVAGTMTLGEVVQAAAAFSVVQGSFNWFTNSYGGIAEWTSSANRVASLLLALDQVDGPASPAVRTGDVADPVSRDC